MQRGPTGDWLPVPSSADEPVRAFVPRSLPPDPMLAPDPVHREELEQALVALGRLDGVARSLPDIALFLYAYVRKEAVLSSQIEGTKSTLDDLLLFEIEAAPGVPLDDVREVSSYVRALEQALWKAVRLPALPRRPQRGHRAALTVRQEPARAGALPALEVALARGPLAPRAQARRSAPGLAQLDPSGAERRPVNSRNWLCSNGLDRRWSMPLVHTQLLPVKRRSPSA